MNEEKGRGKREEEYSGPSMTSFIHLSIMRAGSLTVPFPRESEPEREAAEEYRVPLQVEIQSNTLLRMLGNTRKT